MLGTGAAAASSTLFHRGQETESALETELFFRWAIPLVILSCFFLKGHLQSMSISIIYIVKGHFLML